MSAVLTYLSRFARKKEPFSFSPAFNSSLHRLIGLELIWPICTASASTPFLAAGSRGLRTRMRRLHLKHPKTCCCCCCCCCF